MLMTKVDAIDVIIKDARSEKSTSASLRRLRRAMNALYLSPEEQIEVEKSLEYRRLTGEVYDYYISPAKEVK
jgi:hypothetical protein